MSFLPKSILGKKIGKDTAPPIPPPQEIEDQFINTEETLPAETEIPATLPPKPILRGPGGKFISKKIDLESISSEHTPTITYPLDKEKTTDEKETAIETNQIETGLLTATFYGNQIRKYYLDGDWYFAIEDILPLAQYDDPLGALESFKKKEESKKTFDKVVKEIRDSDNVVECVNYGGFMELLPILRSEEHMFPGPFPSWLEDTSKFPYANPT